MVVGMKPVTATKNKEPLNEIKEYSTRDSNTRQFRCQIEIERTTDAYLEYKNVDNTYLLHRMVALEQDNFMSMSMQMEDNGTKFALIRESNYSGVLHANP